MTAPFPSLESNDSPSSSARLAKLAFAVLLAWLGRAAFETDLGYLPLLGDLEVAIHEAGHLIFMPFGRMLWVLGGSLTQVAFPLVFAVYFARWRKDSYSAAACTWWSGINLIGVAVYCGDARAGQLTLIDGSTGQDSDNHDWKILLKMWHLLEQDTLIAHWMRATAAVMCLASIGVMVWTLLQGPASAPMREETA